MIGCPNVEVRKGWFEGNFSNGDANVDAVDLAALGLNWAPSDYSVPKPATLSVLALGALALLRRKR